MDVCIVTRAKYKRIYKSNSWVSDMMPVLEALKIVSCSDTWDEKGFIILSLLCWKSWMVPS